MNVIHDVAHLQGAALLHIQNGISIRRLERKEKSGQVESDHGREATRHIRVCISYAEEDIFFPDLARVVFSGVLLGN